MLTLKGITKKYKVANGEVEALKGLDVSFRKNEFVSILGPSGCGKTTTLNIIGGLDKYSEGDLIISGKSTKDFTDKDWDAYRNHKIGFVFQSYNLIPHQTVLGNVELALTIGGVSKVEREKRALKALERVGLKGEEYKRPNQLSGGQCQRVAIARALVNEPDILLADEPTGALDSKTSVQIMELIKEISKDKLVIMVTHNSEIAEQYSTRIVRLVDGEIVEDTNPYVGEEKLQEKKDKKEKVKKDRSKMKFWTAFKLSLRNLFTKRGRTILTSFAGSIGIIGISLILAVSQGTTAYINHVQKTTLSSYPITLESESIDLTTLMQSFMGVGKGDITHDTDKIYKDPVIFEMVNALSKVESSENDLKSFKAYLESEIDKPESNLAQAISGIKYSYGIDFDIYTKNIEGEIVKSDTKELMTEMVTRFMMGVATGNTQLGGNNSQSSSLMNNPFSSMMMSSGLWEELLSAKDGGVVNEIIKEQYNLIHGEWPTAYNEVVIVVNDRNEIDDLTLYAMGLLSKDKIDAIIDSAVKGEEMTEEEVSWTYKDVCDREYKIVLPFNNYAKMPGTDIWYDNSAMLDVNGLYEEKGIPLVVKGIIRENPEAENHMIKGSICYTYKLTEHVLNEAKNSDVVKAQLNNPNVDIFTGKPFNSSTGAMTEAQKKTAFIEYASDLSVNKKAETYIAIKSLLGEEELQSLAEIEYAKYTTREEKIDLVANKYYEKQEDQQLTLEQIKAGLNELTDEYVNNATMLVCKGEVMQANAMKVGMQIVMANGGMADINATYSNIAQKFDQEVIENQGNAYLDSDYAYYYDTLTEFSDASYEINLTKLGYADIDNPFAINIYASSFENKDVIVASINEYNSGVEEVNRIKYTDFMGLMMSSITTIIDAITYVLIAFVAISLIVSSIMIGVITLISVQERTKEIGILRAIGASKKDVSRMFNAETIIIGFTSGVLGALVTYLLCIPINLILQALTGIPTLRAILPFGAAVILTVISVLLTLIAGIIPSRSASKKDPVVALRTE